uniref:RING-type domain-containing protein n=1 Tax=Calcidiscus leptoporus TaxID=127549 RepID=A0A7S0J4D9_9EUKA|mmetsp:Transcript_38943/g.91071  ORF Transcript_38943/g.91071 Transcript_38943/m.91071 type:complete len:154 (+) Transcript_38943:210-671(+)
MSTTTPPKFGHDMHSCCPLCLESPADTVAVPCAHQFCAHCLAQWAQRQPTCPLCRTILTVPVSRSSQQTSSDALQPIRGTLRERAEREEAARERSRASRAALRQRLDRYQSEFITPSGRPFESLPLATMEDIRKLGQKNRFALAGICQAREGF